MKNKIEILENIILNQNLTKEEYLELYSTISTNELLALGNEVKNTLHPNNIVSWQIDRNINTTNACITNCKFCNFQTNINDKAGIYVTSLESYSKKIEETIALGGDQILLQGGLSPALDLDYYCNLFRELKVRFPSIKIHALGPPEVAYLAKQSKITVEATLTRLRESGLDSLPGAGAEILVDRVRKIISPAKLRTKGWLDVMRIAHKMHFSTSATMMYGHIETLEDHIDHLLAIKEVQAERPKGSVGFIAFIPWPYMGKNTQLEKQGIKEAWTPESYLRLIAISRIVLTNIPNIQASWLTAGVETAIKALSAGANDMGSIMIEENVVSQAGANHHLNASRMQEVIKGAGFTPQLRDQGYNPRLNVKC